MTQTTRRLMAACAVLLAVATALLLALNHAKIESTLEKRARDRQQLVAGELAKALEAHLALGLALEDTPALRVVLERTLAADPQMHAVAVLDTRGRTVLAAGPAQHPALWLAARPKAGKGAAQGYARDGASGAIGLPLRNAFDITSGLLVAEYSLEAAQSQARAALWRGLPAAGGALLAALLVLGLLGQRLGGRVAPDVVTATADPAESVAEGTNRRLSALVTALVLAVQGVIAWDAYAAFDRIASEDAPQLAATVAYTVRPDVERALELQIPLSDLVGVRDWLEPLLRANPVFNAVELRDAEGVRVLHTAGTTGDPATPHPVAFEFPIEHQGTSVGRLVVRLNLAALSERARQLGIEFATLLIAAALLIHEAVRLVNRPGGVGAPAELTRLRAPLFVFFLASELPRSFLPVWSNELATRPLPAALATWLGPTAQGLLAGVPDTVLATVPISVFLLSVALASPLAGRICSTQGTARLLHLGFGLAMLGHVFAMVSDSLLALCLARATAGASFGFVSIAAFDVVGRQAGGRAAGMALYLAAYVAGGVCGSGLGALLADRSGYAAAFVLGLSCCLLAMALARQGLGGEHGSAERSPAVLGSLALMFRQPAFVRVLVLLALPMQVVQQGLLFYWAPLALARLGESASFVGLAMMGYFLMVLFVNGPAARYADHTGQQARLTVAALLLAGLAAAASGWVHEPWVIAGAIVVVGLAWAFGFPSLGAVALHMCQGQLRGVEPAVAMGIYRSIERVGAMLAPVFVAVLLVAFGHAVAAQVMGALLLGCALLYTALTRGVKSA